MSASNPTRKSSDGVYTFEMTQAIPSYLFDTFLRKYFDQFAFQSVTTENFVEYLRENLQLPDADCVDDWIYGPGLPGSCPQIQSTALARIESDVQRFLEQGVTNQLQVADWSTHHWLHFLRSLPAPLSHDQMLSLDQAFQLTRSGNSEVLFEWLLHAIKANYQPATPALESFLTRQGRLKFLKPLYKELITSVAGRQLAEQIYDRARDGYRVCRTRLVI